MSLLDHFRRIWRRGFDVGYGQGFAEGSRVLDIAVEQAFKAGIAFGEVLQDFEPADTHLEQQRRAGWERTQ